MAANASHLPEKERVIRQRVYITLRTFDAYVTSSLGLPRNLRAIEPTGDTTDASSKDIDCPEMLTAADANVELLEILGTAVEKAYFSDTTARNQGFRVVQYNQLREVGKRLERWERKYAVFAQVTDENLLICTK